MDLSHVIITADRLKIVSISEKYASDIFKEFTEEITKYMFPRSPETINDTLEYIRSTTPKMLHGEELPIVILSKETGEFLGGGGAHALNTKTPRFGIWIKKSAHGNKYGREAIHALKNWVDINIDYIYLSYSADKRNIPSIKVAESLGGIFAGEHKTTNQAGDELDLVEYRIYKK